MEGDHLHHHPWLAKGDAVTVVIKASEVLVAK